MADTTRQPVSEPIAHEDPQRDRVVESLLVAGLDLYFAGDYERAIHAWTRVLFLDRSHARARAYIERARQVLAERQRETDELLHRGLAALDAGDSERARQLLGQVVRRGGPYEAAQAALERLERLEHARGRPAERPARPQAAPLAAEGPSARSPRQARRATPLLLAATLALLVAAVALTVAWDRFDAWWAGEPRGAAPAAGARPSPPLPYPLASDLAVRRARTLFARGHLHEALAALETVPAADPRFAEAERLRADVQRALLATIGQPAAPPSAPAGDGSGRP